MFDWINKLVQWIAVAILYSWNYGVSNLLFDQRFETSYRKQQYNSVPGRYQKCSYYKWFTTQKWEYKPKKENNKMGNKIQSREFLYNIQDWIINKKT